MPHLIKEPTRILSAGNLPKIIDEYVGYVNTRESHLSIAHMKSPQGWQEPGQCPEFSEYTIVLKGLLVVETKTEMFEIKAGQGIHTKAGEWVRYSTPDADGAEYIAVCLPAFKLETVHRDET